MEIMTAPKMAFLTASLMVVQMDDHWVGMMAVLMDLRKVRKMESMKGFQKDLYLAKMTEETKVIAMVPLKARYLDCLMVETRGHLKVSSRVAPKVQHSLLLKDYLK